MNKRDKTTTDLTRFFSAGGAALDTITSAFENSSLARIATAYFEPSGWQCLKDVLKGKEVRLLLGRPDTSDDKITDIVKDFFSSLNSGEFDDRTKVIEDLRDAISKGLFLINVSSEDLNQTTLEPKYIYHHAKLYIADNKKAVVTSANFTRHGLTASREAGIIVTDIDDVRFFVDRFDYYFDKGVPIAELLLEKIDEWLKIYEPYDIYITTLLTLYGMPADEKPGKLPPLAGYQRPVVSRIIRNMEDYGGAMLVASTGLGKTIMAGHIVAHLRSQDIIDAAIVLCPSGLKHMWQRTMRAARVSSVEFSYYVMSVDDWRKMRDVSILERELKNADSKTIVILDESHHLRNSDDGTEIRLRHRRIMQMVSKDSKILLMTATPYSKNVDDINSQLMLLPGGSISQSLFGEERNNCWRVDKPGDLSELKCGVVLTAPSVVKHFSSKDDHDNRYVLFSGNEKRFFPHSIIIKNIHYSNPVDNHLEYLLKSGLLYAKTKQVEEKQNILFQDIVPGERNALFESHIVKQFCASLKEADSVLEKMTVDGGYERVRFERQVELTKKADEIRRDLNYYLAHDSGECFDKKISHVVEILNLYPDEKVVIFCVYKVTSDYILKSLEKYIPGLKIKSTVDKDPDELEKIIKNFAPVANSIDIDDPEKNIDEIVNEEDEIRVLVATTAMSEGFNFQDASIMINFDLPWTVLVLAQRMGRILRPWYKPRSIRIFTMIPSTMDHPGINHAMNWNKRLHQRNRDFSSFADIPVMVEKSDEFEMFDLAKSLNKFDDIELNLDEVYKFIENADNLHTSSFIDDLAILDDEDIKYYKKLPEGIRGYKNTGLNFNALFALIRYKNRYFPAIFSESGEIYLDDDRIDDIMRIIRSKKDEDYLIQLIDSFKLDKWYNKIMKNWSLARNVDINDITLKCMMILNRSK